MTEDHVKELSDFIAYLNFLSFTNVEELIEFVDSYLRHPAQFKDKGDDERYLFEVARTSAVCTVMMPQIIKNTRLLHEYYTLHKEKK